MGKSSKGRTKNSFAREKEQAEKLHNKNSAYGGTTFDGVARGIMNQTDEDNEAKELRKDLVRDKKDLVNQDLYRDRDGVKPKRVGKPSKPYLGTRVTKPKHYRNETTDILDFITDISSGRYGLYMPIFDTVNGRQWVAMATEMYFKHNRSFMNNIAWYHSCAFFLKHFVVRNIDTAIANKNRKTYLLGLRHKLAEINSIFGPAFIPNNYYQIGEVRHYLLHIPIKQLKNAQSGFVTRYGYVNHVSYSMFGKEFSSDITGDGPEFSRAATVTHYLNSVPIDFANACYFMWIEDPMVFRDHNDIIMWILHRDRLWDEDELLEVDEPTDEMCMVIMRLHKCHNIFRISVIKEKFAEGRAFCPFLNGNNGEWTGSDDVAFERFLKSIWLYNFVCGVKWFVLNFHLVLWFMLNVSVKLNSIYYMCLIIKHVWDFCFMIQHDLTEFASSFAGYLVCVTLFNYINVTVFDFEIPARRYVPARHAEDFGQPVNREDEDQEDMAIFEDDPILHRHERREGLVDRFFNMFRVGAGKGNSMISNKIKNKGTGGKSKNTQKTALADPKGVEKAQKVTEKENPKQKDDDESLYSNFVYADFPKMRTQFTADEAAIPTGPAGMVEIDCHGAPFCGLTCIDIACGIKPNLKEYKARAECLDDVFDLGTEEYLVQYANYRGKNLMIFQNDQLAPDGRRVRVCTKHPNSPGHQWIALTYQGEQVPDGHEATSGYVGHWILNATAHTNEITGNREDPLVFLGADLGRASNINVKSYLFGLIVLRLRYLITEVMAGADCEDVRETTQKRIKYEVDDTYFKATWSYSYHIDIPGIPIELQITHALPATVIGVIRETLEHGEAYLAFLNANLPVYLRFDFFFNAAGEGWLLQLFDAILYFIRPTLISTFTYVHFTYLSHLNPRNNVIISFQKFKRVIMEAQASGTDDVQKCLALISQTGYINTNSNFYNILQNTREFSEVYISIMKRRQIVVNFPRVAVNAPNFRAVVANIGVVRRNQELASRKGGNKPTNHVLKAKIKKCVVNQPVAVAPTIGFSNNGRPLGPGPIPVTDDLGLLTAFCGRSMSKDPTIVNHSALNKLEKFSNWFIDRCVTSMVTDNIQQQDPRDAITRLYKGKKPQKFIKGLVDGYTRHLAGKQDKKYYRPQCFVKLENSAKVVNKFVRSKPRLIMVMSELMLMEYCQVIDVINSWNEGFFKKFQIKHETNETIIKKVMEVTNQTHTVTDYSSFECSIIGKIRAIENNCIKKCLEKAGLTVALNRFVKDFEKSRELTTKNCTFEIHSRNSGDFHTSWMNGFINVLLGAYTYHVNHPEDPELLHFQMIGEGDDGLRAPNSNDAEVAGDMGFSFSQSMIGHKPGDVDFLKVRWIDGKKLVDVGRALKLCWVVAGRKISKKNALCVQRCAALSYHHACPGHPILWALIKRIGMETRPMTAGTYVKSLFNQYSSSGAFLDEVFSMSEKRFPDVSVDESLRAYVASGAAEFPPISIAAQLALEKSILDPNTKIINLCGLLDSYDTVYTYSNYDYSIDYSKNYLPSIEVEEMLEAVGITITPERTIIDRFDDTYNYSKSME